MGLLFLLSLLTLLATGANAAEPNADEIVERSNLAYYYAGTDGSATVKMTITDSAERVRTREFSMLRYDVKDGAEQKFYVYFRTPADVEGMIFMVWKNTKKDDDRWLYIPAVDLVKRVAAKNKRSSFAGSHSTYEDVSGRSTGDDTHELIGSENIDGREAYVILNRPKDADIVEFSEYKVWIDKVHFLPLKGEYFDKAGKLYKTLLSERIEVIDDIATVVQGRVTVEGRGSTVIQFSNVKYNVGITEKIFDERYLRRPPRRWIK
ncbi:MAG: outer membrane lipoprotein-sorting protein [Proteobacteria bacterium]|nr:outer membrane lipoprotein-sorting protein [Pseudomonadota bacterium]